MVGRRANLYMPRSKRREGGGTVGCLKRREEGDGRAVGRRAIFYTTRKRRRARARALPEAEAAKLRGAKAKTLQCHDFLSEDSNLPRTSKIPRASILVTKYAHAYLCANTWIWHKLHRNYNI
jgi:hypothetical protein